MKPILASGLAAVAAFGLLCPEPAAAGPARSHASELCGGGKKKKDKKPVGDDDEKRPKLPA